MKDLSNKELIEKLVSHCVTLAIMNEREKKGIFVFEIISEVEEKIEDTKEEIYSRMIPSTMVKIKVR